MIDVVDHLEKFVGIEPVLLHQAAQARAVAPIEILLHPKRFVVGQLKEVGDVVADALVDLLPKIEVMRVERVVEIEHPGLDGVEAASAVARTLRCLRLHRTGPVRSFMIR